MTAHIYNWTDGYVAVRHCALESRGSVELDTGARWPRTTGEDVVAIAALFDAAVRANATAGVMTRWRATLADLERDAVAAPNETYEWNRAFWSTLESVTAFLDNLAVTPPKAALWDALLTQLAAPVPVRNVGPRGDGPFKHFDGVKTFDDLYIEQFKYLRDLRGFDRMRPEPGTPGPEKPIPATTNGDVVALADYWSKQLADIKVVMGHDDVVKRWKAALVDVDALARKGDPIAVYPKNNSFWRALQATAIHVAVADEAPTKWDLAKEAIKESVTSLPENLEHVASKGVDLVASTANAVGKVANEAGRGLFAGFGTPLLVGAGLLGLFLVSRNRRESKEV